MMEMLVKLHGVRCSLPSPVLPTQLKNHITHLFDGFCKSPYAENLDYKGFLDILPMHTIGGFGGNTISVEVSDAKKNSIFIDAGTGIRTPALELMQKSTESGNSEIHILFTHYNLDTIMGLPLFLPLYKEGNTVHFYTIQNEFESHIKTLLNKQFSAASLEQLPAKIQFHTLEVKKTVSINGFSVTPYFFNQKSTSAAYKIEKNGKTYSHCVNTENDSGKNSSNVPDIQLYQNVNFMLHDGQHTITKKYEKIDSGNVSAPVGLEIAMKEKVKKILFTNHDAWASDDEISERFLNSFDQLLEYLNKNKVAKLTIDWGVAYEGQIIEVN